jgi:hypothetical protein
MPHIQSLYKKHIIPPGTILFRKAPNKCFFDTMFFAFCKTGPTTSNTISNSVQVWKTNSEIQSLCMLRGRSQYGNMFSAIVEIYNMHFPNDRKEEWEDLELKKHDTVRRRRLIKSLKDEGINSWVSSVEDNHVMELFMFANSEVHQSLFSYQQSYKILPGYDTYPDILSINNKEFDYLPIIKKEYPPMDDITRNMLFRFE